MISVHGFATLACNSIHPRLGTIYKGLLLAQVADKKFYAGLAQ